MNTIKLLKNVIMSSPGHILLYVGLFFVVTVFGEIRVGLVLGGGAARGLAHIGVLKALEEYNIPIDAVGGTSMGAIIGALWSSGYSASEIESIFVQTNVLNQIFDFSFENEKPVYYKFNYQNTILNLYYNKGKLQRPEAAIDDRLLNFEIKKFFQPVEIAIDSNFRNLWKPFLCTASDINSSKLLVFTSGSLSKAVRSSMSLPIIFKPVEYEDKILLDGGIYNNLPVKITADSFNLDYIISVDVSTHKTVLSSDNIDILDIGFSMMDLITKGINADTMEEYGTYIHPDVNAFFGYEFYKVKELIDLGYNEAIKHIQKMKNEI
ncbi:patatin-like phospholipase family protein, partial [candidate division WOR-3 bacterium]|nr:patatin-like phospholipase family protein [candidate division WOR-3 bacterium]